MAGHIVIETFNSHIIDFISPIFITVYLVTVNNLKSIWKYYAVYILRNETLHWFERK